MNHPPAAHTPNDRGKWHELEKHLKDVAELAQKFSNKFGASKVGYLAGLWHDLGKYKAEFQTYLQRCHHAKLTGQSTPRKGVPHAPYGAELARQIFPPLTQIIYGHHVGLPEPERMKNKLKELVDKSVYQTIVGQARESLGNITPCIDLSTLIERPPTDILEMEFFNRMLFSALVDADYLDTESHFDVEKAKLRNTKRQKKVAELWPVLEQNQNGLLRKAQTSGSTVNEVRAEVYHACIKAAEMQPGIFRLAVPTGGGKTRSGLAFALKHALYHHHNRVIVAVPYTSIIEQTVDVYRGIFGDDVVLEHHSAVRDDKQGESDEDQNAAAVRSRLLTQNWDASLVVTTTVQLFESLFANRPSRCRKLHNVAHSVIILDEVQTLPLALLKPILNVLQELIRRYGVTVVLCTATQPAFETNSRYLEGFAPGTVRNIIAPQQAKVYFEKLERRVEYIIQKESWDWATLVDKIREHDQVLVILNTRKDALAVLDALDEDHDVFHLSTLLCGAHRRKVLEEVKARLNHDNPKSVCLVSTQVVEAGVDFDFPVVYRALGPLDRIVQAAGRCNREGRQHGGGKVIIFKPAVGGMPRGNYKTAFQESERLLDQEDVDLCNPVIFQRYFENLYQLVDTDYYKIQLGRESMNYPETAKGFKLIRDDTIPVMVKYEDAEKLIEKIRRFGKVLPCDYKKIQLYVVSLRKREFDQYKDAGYVGELLHDSDIWLWQGRYDEALRGLSDIGWDPADLMQ